MKPDTFMDKAIYITIIIFIFTLVFNFLMGVGVFTDEYVGGGIQIEYDNDGNQTIKEVTKSEEFEQGVIVTNLWEVVLLGGIGGVVLAIATHSTNIIGVYLFSVTFWATYLNLLDILRINNFLTGTIWGLVLIGTACVILLFIAAVIGMLSGSG